jgi:hypothetical protein
MKSWHYQRPGILTNNYLFTLIEKLDFIVRKNSFNLN